MTSHLKGTWLRLSVLLCLLSGLSSAPVLAQSLIFNVPSTDVMAKDKLYLEFDYYAHLESLENGGYHGFYPRAVYGLGKGVEAGVNVSWSKSLTPGQPVQVSPNVKWQLYSNEEKGLAVTTGAIAYVTVKNREGANDYGMLYTNASKKFKGDYGPRLTGGYYQLVGNTDGLGTNKGAMLGYEQPLHSRVSFTLDWFSGNNSNLSYLTPALSVTLPKNSLFFAGWMVGNQGRKNNYLYVGYGVTL